METKEKEEMTNLHVPVVALSRRALEMLMEDEEFVEELERCETYDEVVRLLMKYAERLRIKVEVVEK